MFFRPMSFGEIMDGIFRSLRKTFWPLWWFLFLFNVPFELFFVLWDAISDKPLNAEIILFLTFLAIYLLLLVPVFQQVCTNVVICQMKGEEEKVSLKYLFSISFDRYGKLFLANGLIVLILIVLGLMIMFPIGLPFLLLSTGTVWMDQVMTILTISGLMWMIPASYIWIRISLVLPAIAVETASVKEGFARSWALTRKSYFSLISKWLLLLIFQIPVYFLSVYLSEIFVDAQFFYDLIFLLIDPILIGMVHVLLSLIYMNQRAKKEGFDLQLMLEKRGEAP